MKTTVIWEVMLGTYPETVGSRFLQNVGTYLPDYTASNTEGHNLNIIVSILIFS
jgi:hypothetical protein